MSEEDPKRWDLTTKVKALVCCLLLFLNFFETSLVSLSSLSNFRGKGERDLSSSADLVFLPLVYLALVVLHYIQLQLQTDW
jgi:hypothetical protein